MSCIFQAEEQNQQNLVAPCLKLITKTELEGHMDVKIWGPLVVVFSDHIWSAEVDSSLRKGRIILWLSVTHPVPRLHKTRFQPHIILI